jgi:hypothetical protein
VSSLSACHALSGLTGFAYILDIQGAIKNFQNRKYARGKSDILAYAIPAVPACQLISVHVPDDAAHIGNYTAAE